MVVISHSTNQVDVGARTLIFLSTKGPPADILEKTVIPVGFKEPVYMKLAEDRAKSPADRK